uniref:Uncharacterized protein n=1 Tax=Anas platyrhynchos TaxID=8839 RepID=A0A8B9SKG0_ANAPL
MEAHSIYRVFEVAHCSAAEILQKLLISTLHRQSIHRLFKYSCFTNSMLTSSTERSDYELLLSLSVCFFSGSKELPSNKILFLIPSLSILCRILCLAKLYLQ